MEGICMNFLDTVQFFHFLKGYCHGNQFCGKITYPLVLIAVRYDTAKKLAHLVEYLRICWTDFCNFFTI